MRIAVLSVLIVCCSAASWAAKAPAGALAVKTFIAGTTVDADTGTPIPNVALRAHTKDFHSIPNGACTSDRNGKFRLAVPPGVIVMDYVGRGYIYDDRGQPLPRFTVPKTGLQNAVMKIPRRQVLIGDVRDPSRKYLRGSSVTIGPRGWNPGAIADNFGRFVLIVPARMRSTPG